MENDPRNPMDVTDAFWVYCRNAEIANAARNIHGSQMGGKWMIFVPNEQLNESWAKAKHLYNAGELTGVIAMKVSTAKSNSRASSRDNAVIIFYCGPVDDEARVTQFGRNLVDKLDYKHPRDSRYVQLI